jgi:hypothetical protein
VFGERRIQRWRSFLAGQPMAYVCRHFNLLVKEEYAQRVVETEDQCNPP